MISIMLKIPVISVESHMERFVSVISDGNIRDHLWRWSLISVGISTEICRSIFDKPVHCPTSFHLCKELGKGMRKW